MLLIKSVPAEINAPMSGFTYLEVPPMHRVDFYRNTFGGPMVAITDVLKSSTETVHLFGDTYLMDGKETLQQFRELENYTNVVLKDMWNNFFHGTGGNCPEGTPCQEMKDFIGFCEIVINTNSWTRTTSRHFDWLRYRRFTKFDTVDLEWLAFYIKACMSINSSRQRYKITVNASFNVIIASYVYDASFDAPAPAPIQNGISPDKKVVTNLLRGEPWRILDIINDVRYSERPDLPDYIATAVAALQGRLVKDTTLYVELGSEGIPTKVETASTHHIDKLNADELNVTGSAIYTTASRADQQLQQDMADLGRKLNIKLSLDPNNALEEVRILQKAFVESQRNTIGADPLDPAVNA